MDASSTDYSTNVFTTTSLKKEAVPRRLSKANTKLTQKPVIAKSKTPAIQAKVVQAASNGLNSSPLTNPASGSSSSSSSDLFNKPVTKKQSQLIKNRETADKLRQKKKEEVSNLEEKLTQYQNENCNLKSMYDVMREQNLALKKEMENLKKAVKVKPQMESFVNNRLASSSSFSSSTALTLDTL
eukprot:Awhi_evm1s7376